MGLKSLLHRSLNLPVQSQTIRDRIRHLLPVVRLPDIVIRQVFLLLLIAHLQTELSSVLSDVFPSLMNKKLDLFLSPWFSYKMPLCWWVKYLTNDVFEVLVFYAFAKVAKQYSISLFLVIVVLLVYHVVDLAMYLWNFKTSHYMMWDCLWTTYIFIRIAIQKYKPETIAKIKSLF